MVGDYNPFSLFILLDGAYDKIQNREQGHGVQNYLTSNQQLSTMQTQQSSNGLPHRYVSPLDVHLMKLYPNHRPKSEASMIRSILGRHDPSRLEELWGIHVERANAIVARLQGNLKPLKAAKPKPGDPSVVFYDIPSDEHLAVRRWDGALENERAYCFDLYDKSKEIAINVPAEFEFLQFPSNSNTLPTSREVETMKMHSWEETWGHRREDLVAGYERFIAREGWQLALIRPNKTPFFFTFPQRPAVYNGVPVNFAPGRCG